MGTEECQVCDKCHKEKPIDELEILKRDGKQYHIHTCKIDGLQRNMDFQLWKSDKEKQESI